jgi:hypothetical protein
MYDVRVYIANSPYTPYLAYKSVHDQPKAYMTKYRRILPNIPQCSYCQELSESLPRILYQMYALHDTYAKCTLTPLYETPKCTPRARPSDECCEPHTSILFTVRCHDLLHSTRMFSMSGPERNAKTSRQVNQRPTRDSTLKNCLVCSDHRISHHRPQEAGRQGWRKRSRPGKKFQTT